MVIWRFGRAAALIDGIDSCEKLGRLGKRPCNWQRRRDHAMAEAASVRVRQLL